MLFLFLLENANITIERQRLRGDSEGRHDTTEKPLKHAKERKDEREKNNDSMGTAMTPKKKKKKKRIKLTNCELIQNSNVLKVHFMQNVKSEIST